MICFVLLLLLLSQSRYISILHILGKSNIMDAISFALGEKPIALRVKRLSELIYKVPIGESTDTVERYYLLHFSIFYYAIRCFRCLICYSDTYVKVIFRINGINESSFTRTIHGETSQYKIDDKVKFYATIHNLVKLFSCLTIL